jgi:hypothetical protein
MTQRQRVKHKSRLIINKFQTNSFNLKMLVRLVLSTPYKLKALENL